VPSFNQIPPLSDEISCHGKRILTDDEQTDDQHDSLCLFCQRQKNSRISSFCNSKDSHNHMGQIGKSVSSIVNFIFWVIILCPIFVY